jgi:predicted nucleotide-binding protein (sugar kinase/HSP70/actin superfamily)
MTKTAPRIGIPRAMLYYKFGPLWRTFFEDLGCKVVLSPNTNKAILNAGLLNSVDESCLSSKIFLGHVDSLRGKVDHIFVPRMWGLRKGEELCTKFLALRDIAYNTFPNESFLDYSLDHKTRDYEFPEMFKMAWRARISRDPLRITRAYLHGKRELRASQLAAHAEQERAIAESTSDLKVLLVAHAYNATDKMVGEPITRVLESLDAMVIHADKLDPEIARKLPDPITDRLYWAYNKELVGAVEYYRGQIDGIIFVVTFPCGPDAMVTDMCERRVKDVPIITMIIDELQGEAGMKTRLESFVDILRMKKSGAVAGRG